MTDVLELARTRFKHVQDFEAENRTGWLEAIEFSDGKQWPDAIRSERERENRPCLVINRVPQFVRQIVNDIRQIRPAIKVRPVDSEADPETAEVLNGMIRAIEQASSAESAYDWAAEAAVRSGVGYWRIVTDYVDDRSFDQEIRIERVRNLFSVYIDPAATSQDASDMRYAFVVERMPKSEFETKYPGKQSEWTLGDTDDQWWFGDDYVRVAEYWEVVCEPIILSMMPDGMIYEGEVEGAIATRKAERKRVIQRLVTGADVLEENEWPGQYIPIVRVMGRELDVQGELRVKGMVKDLMDPQRQYNYWRTASTERVALFAKAPYIGPKGAFRSQKWRTANTKNHAFLEYEGEIAPRREPPPDISPGFANEIQVAAEELKAVSGIHDPGLGARSNEVSGVAIDSRKLESDVSNFDFVDNLAKAMTYAGKVLVDLIPKIYSGPRLVRILKPGSEDELVKINQAYVDRNQKDRLYDLNAGKYDVSVDVGPSFTTQRQEASKSMLEVLRIFPQAGELVGDILAKNFDWPEADEIAKRLRTILPAQVLQGENPAIAQLVQSKDMEINALKQQMQALMTEAQRMSVELQNKTRDIAVKEGDLRRKIAKDIMDHREGMTDLEIKANKDLGPQGAYL